MLWEGFAKLFALPWVVKRGGLTYGIFWSPYLFSSMISLFDEFDRGDQGCFAHGHFECAHVCKTLGMILSGLLELCCVMVKGSCCSCGNRL